MTDRLDKWLCDRSTFSRKDVKAIIRSGRVKVNGETASRPDAHIGETDAVMLDGKLIAANQHIYIMLNKPKGVVSVSNAPDDRTVIDLIPDDLRRNGLFPAGRLDRDTTGFVLITDDGEFAHRILSPRRHVVKTYTATLRDAIQDGYEHAFREGIVLGDGTKCMSADLVRTEDPRRVIVRLREGRYHQVKRMFASLGNHVTHLHRDAIGGLALDPLLREGECRVLTPEEVNKITEEEM
ncbi:MAG: 16S rRNA pseudouridine(516) synthase [Clostridia bacterium]|nr:16S rRNA pseudouridine(516) synthase [Clostridia bacterium]